MRTSRRNLGAYVIVGEDVGFYVVLILSQNLYFYFMLSQVHFLSILLILFYIFSSTSVVRRESSFCKSIYKHESNKIVMKI